jgi:hypothetical protein
MITIEKINVFNSFDGDSDRFERIGSNYNKNLFENNDWSTIASLIQDIELINKKLVAQTYIDQTLVKLKENCDCDSLEILINKIECYKNFQQVAEILKQIKSLTNSESNTFWTRFDSTELFLVDLNQDIANIENCNYSTLDKVQREFLPTSTYQEISISNGWGDYYLKLSNDFDNLFVKQTEIKITHINSLPKKSRSWWQTIFGFE